MLIEGIGDEVLHFFMALLAVIVVVLAWRTTNIGNHWHVHTFYLLDGSLLRRLRNHRRLTNHIEVATISESTMASSENNEDVDASSSNDSAENNENLLQVEEEQEQSEIVQTMDGNLCTLRQRRVLFYDNNVCNSNNSNAESEANDNNEEADASVEICVNSAQINCDLPVTDQSSIRIKLKYINDDLKLVEGYLEENLGDFKRRHFNEELSSNKLVKLIFNGQILEHENDTLQQYGLFDNCVVHCLIHQSRVNDDNNEVNERSRSSSSGIMSNNNNNSREWDFGNMLIGLLSFILATAWYFRYQYQHLFTVTATVALVAITGIFTIISVGMYFPDPQTREEVNN